MKWPQEWSNCIKPFERDGSPIPGRLPVPLAEAAVDSRIREIAALHNFQRLNIIPTLAETIDKPKDAVADKISCEGREYLRGLATTQLAIFKFCTSNSFHKQEEALKETSISSILDPFNPGLPKLLEKLESTVLKIVPRLQTFNSQDYSFIIKAK